MCNTKHGYIIISGVCEYDCTCRGFFAVRKCTDCCVWLCMLQSCFFRAVVTISQLSVLQWYSRVEQKAHEKEDSHGSSAQLDSCFLWLDSLAKQYNLIILASRWFTAKVSRELSFYELSVLRNRMLWTRIIPCTRRTWCNSSEFLCTIDIWAQATGCVQSEVCPEIWTLPLAQARSLPVATLSQLQVGANGDASNSLGCLFKTRRANGEIAHDFLDLTSCWLAEVRGFGEIVWIEGKPPGNWI